MFQFTDLLHANLLFYPSSEFSFFTLEFPFNIICRLPFSGEIILSFISFYVWTYVSNNLQYLDLLSVRFYCCLFWWFFIVWPSFPALLVIFHWLLDIVYEKWGWRVGIWMTFAFPREDVGFFGRLQTTDGSACFCQVWRWFESRLQDLGSPGLFLTCSFRVLHLKLVDSPGPPPPCWILTSKSCFPSIERLPKSIEQNVELIFLWFLSLWDLSPWVLPALAVLQALPTPRFFCCFSAASIVVLNRKSTLHSRYSVAAGSRASVMGLTSCLLQARACLGGVDTGHGCESWNFRPTAEGRLALGISGRGGSLPLLLLTAWPWVSHRNCQGLRVHPLQSGSNTWAVYYIDLVWGEPLGHSHRYSENRELSAFLSNIDDAMGPKYRDGIRTRAFCYV